MTMELHGGDVWKAASVAGFNASRIIDFSANINPAGLPETARRVLLEAAGYAADLLRYPDWTSHPLRFKLARNLNIATDCVVLGAGASALITDAVRALAPSRSLAFGPAFSEYRRAATAARSAFTVVSLSPQNDFRLCRDHILREAKRTEADLVFLNNPHNPSGSFTRRDEMLRIIDDLIVNGISMVLDEAFIDYIPGQEVTAEAVRWPGVIAIRSLTKFYGCPALRVGYAVAHRDTAIRLEAQMPAWPVGSLALTTLDAALDDGEFAQATIAKNDRERFNLSTALESIGLRIYPAASNFLLIELPAHWPSSSAIRDRLLRSHALLVRNCDGFETLAPGRYIRAAVLDRERNRLLIAALESLKDEVGS